MLIELLTERYPGMRFWLLQRITAVFMAFYVLVAIVYFMLLQPASYQAWLVFNQPWWWRIGSSLFFLSLCMHAWVGVRDVFRDYVSSQVIRNILQVLVEVTLFACLVWSVVIFWSV